MVRAWDRLGHARLLVVYLLAMPLLAGLPRGRYLPVVRPSEGLQLTLTGIAVIAVVLAAIGGRRWELRIQRHEWWLAATVLTGSVVPILWLVARRQPVTGEELLASFPLIKFGALYLLVRACVTGVDQVRALMLALMVVAAALSTLAVAQALRLGPTAELIGRYFVSSVDDVADGGRATTTIGSSIATGAFLTLALAVAFTRALVTGRHRWLAVTAVLGLGALASGQAGTVVALVIVTLTAIWAHKTTSRLPLERLALLSLPVLALASVVLWPVVVDRLADVSAQSGLPTSWVMRWSNVSHLYLPSLLDWGWVLGVSPDTEQVPPDLWRESVYLESGYLWMLWIGGVPLLVAAIGFLVSALTMTRVDRPGPADGTDAGDHTEAGDRTDAGDWMVTVKTSARAGVAMMIGLSVIDPHLTMRAGADLFFVLVALAATCTRFARPLPASAAIWRTLLGADHDRGSRPSPGRHYPSSPRLYMWEATHGGNGAETAVGLGVVDSGTTTARTVLTMSFDRSRSRGRLGIVVADDDRAYQLLMRAVAMVAGSMRLDELQCTGTNDAMIASSSDGGTGLTFTGRELARAARLARRLERDRGCGAGYASTGHRGRPGPIRLDARPAMPKWKRVIDLGLGAMAIVATAPLWLAVAVLVRRSSPGPVLFRQLRVGLGGLPFAVCKFRTMYVDNDDSDHRRQNELEMAGEAEGHKDENDPRVTPVGRWLRRLSLDELPQLINVLRAEMSLVGPRPSLLWEVGLFPPPTRRRLAVPPGITGLWQTSGRARLSMPEMLELDLRYVDESSPGTDLRCLVRTVGAVVGGEGAT